MVFATSGTATCTESSYRAVDSRSGGREETAHGMVCRFDATSGVAAKGWIRGP